ncbi:GR28B protein, partial [Acromyrmex charruanus]
KRRENKMRQKWSPFYATDFQTLMYPSFTFCRIFGLFPYKINNSIFEISKPQYILSIIITCALCVFQLMYTKSTISTKIDFENIITIIVTSCYCILIVFFAIVTIILSNPRMRLLQTIMEVSSKLSPKSYQKLSKLIHIKDIFGFFYVIGLNFIVFYKMGTNILTLIFLIYTVQWIFQMEMLYVNCVCVLKACFKKINNDLRLMQEIVNNKSCISTISYCEQRNPFLIKLKALEKQYMMISNTIQILNTIFSVQVFVTIVLTLFEVSLELYIYVVKWHNGLVINLSEQVIEIFLLNMIFYTLRMALIFWACETGKNQAQEIRTTIHDVLNDARDEQIKNELQLFSLQLLHCKHTFSAKGFNVDATFLTTMVGTITTYMLITLQFLIALYSCENLQLI